MTLERVEVRWHDSMGESGWHRREEIERNVQRDDYLLCTSVGYLLRRDDMSVTIVQSEMNGGDAVGEPLTIPAVAVQSVTSLRGAGKA